ncbi:unnamed protein product [Cylindrotheca closterium]|uniref:Uncharacterized protein n=1 Tax=Cylindrotheca closterium TaxID=2856 RepID=A0AAD2JN16_9STRA|nr:unnamed protein product [Cylindrotheca closterium]
MPPTPNMGNADEMSQLLGEKQPQSNNLNRNKSWFQDISIWNALSIALFVASLAMLLATHHEQNQENGPRIPTFSTNSKYRQVQGLGFQIYTGGAPALLGQNGTQHLNPECVGLKSYGSMWTEEGYEMQCYIGDPDNEKDAQNRLKIMKDAVEKAYNSADHDPNTLKIFIAPEFFWRGIDGAYVFMDEAPGEWDVCGPVCQILKGLEEIVADKRFENWVFMFGSIIASETVADGGEFPTMFYNFAPLYLGYDPEKTDYHGKRFVVPKRYVSSSDFLTPVRNLNSSIYAEIGQHQLPQQETTVFIGLMKKYDNHMWLDFKGELGYIGYKMIEYGWMMLDGLSLSVEMCLDHQMRISLNAYLADITTGQTTEIPSTSSTGSGVEYVPIPTYQAQIGLVSSAGMTVTTDSLALTDHGVIFLQDGLSNATNRMFWSVEGCELGLQFEGGTEAVQRHASISSTDIRFEHNPVLGFQRRNVYHPSKWEESVKRSFSTQKYQPQLTIFDPVDIAKVAVE